MKQDQAHHFLSILHMSLCHVDKWEDSVCRKVLTVFGDCCFMLVYQDLCTHITILASSLHPFNIHSTYGAFYVKF
jgi:hypothetical protein